MTVGLDRSALSPRPRHTCRLDNPRMRVQNLPHFLRKRISATVTHAASRAKEVAMSDPASHAESPESSRQDANRRRFLKSGAALGAALVAGAGA